MTISKMGSPSVSTATNMDTWQRIARERRKNEKHKHVLNTTRRGTLPKIVKGSRQ